MRADSQGFFWEELGKVKVPKPPKPKIQPPPRTWDNPNYLPGLEDALSLRGINLMTDEELWQCAFNGDKLLYDIEVYWNYFCVCFRSKRTKKVAYLEMDEHKQLDIQKFGWIMQNCCVVGFNNKGYDTHIAQLALAGRPCGDLKAATNQIILNNTRGWEILRSAKIKAFDVNEIDLIEVAPLRGSLKAYAGRGHVKRMQDLPFHPENILSEHQKAITLYYCMNDLDSTDVLFDHLTEQIALRERMSQEYKIDLRSRSDAQIAESVLGDALYRSTGVRPQKPNINPGTFYYYNVPPEIGFISDNLKELLETVRNTRFYVADHGSIDMPKELSSLKIKIGELVYKMGIGGLHSTEECSAHVADDNHVISDFDVESYYPKIILNQGLYPAHLGPAFLKEYKIIVDRRIAAKVAKNAADTESLKIVINGSYGKLGSKYSILYAPQLLIQVTITGQLGLLMLIEAFRMSGIKVISANTDGVTVYCPKHLIPTMEAITTWWQQRMNFKLEETKYQGLYSRDVNNYVAVKVPDKDGKVEVKTKGAFANPWSSTKNMAMRLHKNPQNTICVEAVTEFLSKGTPIYKTICDCTDFTKFVTVRKVNGGAVKVGSYQDPIVPDNKEQFLRDRGWTRITATDWHDGKSGNMASWTIDSAVNSCLKRIPKDNEYLGKNIRWYYAIDMEGEIIYAETGKKVPRSEGAKPCMALPDEFPKDINYQWYIQEAEKLLKEIGYGL